MVSEFLGLAIVTLRGSPWREAVIPLQRVHSFDIPSSIFIDGPVSVMVVGLQGSSARLALEDYFGSRARFSVGICINIQVVGLGSRMCRLLTGSVSNGRIAIGIGSQIFLRMIYG